MNEQTTPKPIDQSPTLDPANEIHQRVLALDELGLHSRRAELTTIGRQLSIDELTELCAILAQLRRKKSGPPSGATGTGTRKRLKRAPVDITKLEF